jgi:hypothetical protein
MSDPASRASAPTVLAKNLPPAVGRVSILAFVGLFAGALPVPIVPGRMLKRVRGATVHDLAARHGLSLTREARARMAEPSKGSRRGALLATAAFIAKRTVGRLGVLGILPPLSAWLEIYALGLLFERYLAETRSSRTVRIDEAEARAVRRSIDRAIRMALSPSLEVKPRGDEMVPSEELRDMTTRIIDGLLLAASALPSYVERRLLTAFERVLSEDGSPESAEAK